jgi:2-oxoglutarate ferredoxin oxidoreductase subunit alpha
VSLLLALNKESIEKHERKITPGGGIIYDPDEIPDPELKRDDITPFAVPLKRLALEAGHVIMRNTIGIGATFGLLGCGLETLNGVIRDNFSRKGGDVVESNIKAAKLGHDFVKGRDFPFRLEFGEGNGQILLSGNEAISIGAIKAGCKFYSAYPMTPASSLLHVFARHEREYGIVVKHTEDELAAVNMAIGASFAGARSMTGTSGGGFALMSEGLGLAAQTETPLVIVEAQRPGPGTGMATHSSQGDLRFVLHASTDEFPRIVLAPGDVNDCFFYTVKAFNLAEKYHLPVIILTDKYLGESYSTVPEFSCGKIKIERGPLISSSDSLNGEYLRYKNTPSGVSPRTIPGVRGGTFVASSYEHDEEGFEREEEDIRIMMARKRFRKLESARKDIPPPVLHGPAKADITILSWGSPKGPILEAIRLLEGEGISANYLQVVFLSPFPSEEIKSAIEKAGETVVIENNMTSQLNSLIREHCLLDVRNKILRFDGRPFNPEDIFEEIMKILRPSREGYSAKVGGRI